MLNVAKNKEQKLILKLFYATGMRVAELIDLKINDLFEKKLSNRYRGLIR